MNTDEHRQTQIREQVWWTAPGTPAIIAGEKDESDGCPSTSVRTRSKRTAAFWSTNPAFSIFAPPPQLGHTRPLRALPLLTGHCSSPILPDAPLHIRPQELAVPLSGH